MKLWIGGELDNSVAEDFRTTRLAVERVVNNLIAGIDASEANDWDVIAILRDDDNFNERIRFSMKAGMDLRLKIPFKEFLCASPNARKGFLVDILLRSLDIIESRYPNIDTIKVSPNNSLELTLLP